MRRTVWPREWDDLRRLSDERTRECGDPVHGSVEWTRNGGDRPRKFRRLRRERGVRTRGGDERTREFDERPHGSIDLPQGSTDLPREFDERPHGSAHWPHGAVDLPHGSVVVQFE